MNHGLCCSVRVKKVFEPQGDGYFIIRDHYLCEHDEVSSTQYVDSYVEGNVLGAYREEWGKHG